MSNRTLNPKEFAAAMRVTVPKTVQAKGRKVFLTVAARVHRELTVNSQVDTGYLRASLAASTTGVPFPTLPDKPTEHKKAVALARGMLTRTQAQAVGAIATAIKKMSRLSFAFGASYAKYEQTGAPANVRRVKTLIPTFVRDAVRAAQHLSSSEAAD